MAPSESFESTQPRVLEPDEPWYLRWRGVIATVGAVALLEFLTHGLGVSIPNPSALVALGVVYSAFVGGVLPGLVSAAIAVLYYWALLYAWGERGWDADAGRRLLTFVIVVPAAGAMVGVLKGRADRAQRRLAEAAVARARREGSDSARAETRIVMAESEARYRQLFHTNQAVKLVIAPENGAIVDANDAAIAFYGYPREKLLSMRIGEINAADPEILRTGVEAASRGQVRFEFQHRLASGELRSVEVYTGPFDQGGRRLLFSIIHDVTAKKKAEDAVREAERTFRTLFETSPDGVMVIDPSNGRPVEANGAMLRMLGYTTEEFRELHMSDFDASASKVESNRLIEKVLREGRDEFETKLRTKDNRLITAVVRVATVQLHGKTYLHSVVRDITEQRAAEIRLVEANQRLGFHMENSPLAVVEWDNEFRLMRWSAGAERIFGWKAAEVLGNRPDEWRLVHEDDLERIWGLMERLTLGSEMRNVTFNRNYTKSGDVLYCRWHNSVRLDASGKMISVLSLVEDITAQEKAETALRASEATNRALLQAIPDLMLRHSRDGVYVGYSCPPGTPLLVPPEVFLGRRIDEVLPPHIAEPAMECLRRTLRLGGVQEYEYSVDRRGEMQHYEVRMVSCGADEVMALVRNITVRVAAEEILKERDALLRRLSEQVPGVIYQYRLFPDGTSCFPYASEGIRDIYAVTPEQVRDSADAVMKALHPDDFDRVIESIQLSARTLANWNCEYRVILPKRGVRWLEGHSVPARLEDGSVLWHGYIWDVTERRMAEDALRESKSILEQAQSVGHIGSWASDLSVEDGNLVWSDECCRIFGIDRDRFDGRIATFFKHVHPDDLERVRKEASVAHRDERHYKIDHRIIRGDGEVRWVHQEAEIELDVNQGPRRLVGVCQDITERVAAEERLREADAQLRQAQKMEAIGLLASGVAHDFNNLLSAIFTHISLTRATLHGNKETAAALDGLEAAAKQAEGVTRALLTFARKGTSDKSPTDLAGVVQTVAQLMRATMRQSIRLVLSVPSPGEPEAWVLGDSTQLQQVLLNLAINARDAMPDGGTMRIGVSYEHEGPESIQGRPIARLVVSDTGVGMDDADIARAFEPFFTTKRGSENSGLGLAIVHGIIKDHGGQVYVKSSPGKGASFSVLLPAIVPPKSSSGSPASVWRAMGDMVVLCVESRQVREIIATRLGRDGFTVVQCSGSDEVRSALTRHGNEVRLLVLDADAKGAGALLSDMESEASIGDAHLIVLTPGGQVAGSGHAGEHVLVLRKPYQVSQLTDLIRAVLSRGRESEQNEVEENAT